MKTSNEQIKSSGVEQLLHAISFPEPQSGANSGIFKGKVVSAKTGSRVFGCIVELLGTGQTYVTSPTGYFKMTNVPEGIYLAKFSFPGFKEVSEAIVIQNGEELDMTLQLEVVE